MSMAIQEKFDAMRPGETLRFPILEASATFGSERLLESGQSLGSNFDAFIEKHRATHDIRIEGDYLVVMARCACRRDGQSPYAALSPLHVNDARAISESNGAGDLLALRPQGPISQRNFDCSVRPGRDDAGPAAPDR
jgi:hypothetical protein